MVSKEDIEFRQWENEVKQWVGLFETDANARLRAATELGLIGIRCRKQHNSVRGNLDQAAPSVFPQISFAELVEIALSDDREPVQCEAVFAVGELAGEEVVDLLLERAYNLKSGTKLHTAITRTLGKIGGPKVKAYLMPQRGDEKAFRGMFGLIDKHKSEHKAFSDELRAPLDRALPTSGTPQLVSSGREIRAWLENIREEYVGEYVGRLAEQLL